MGLPHPAKLPAPRLAMSLIPAAALCLLALGATGVAGDESLEFTLQTKLYSSLQQFPCTRLISAEEGSVGCSSTHRPCRALGAGHASCGPPLCR